MKKYLIAGSVLAAAAVIYFVSSSISAKQQVQYDTILASLGDVSQTVDVTGAVAAAEQYELSFKRQGKISKIHVDVGDVILAGQVLAEISDPTLLSEVDQARAVVSADQANLDRLLSGSTNEEIAISLQKIQKAETDLAASQIALSDAEKSKQIGTDSYIQTSLQDIDDAIFVGQFALDTVYDAILDSEADVEFKTSNSLALSAADTAYIEANGAWTSAKAAVVTAKTSNSVGDILTALQRTRDSLANSSQLLDYAFEAIVGTVLNTQYTASTVETYKSSINSRASAIAAEKTSIQSSINNLTTGLQSLDSSVNTALSNRNKAADALNLTKAEYQLIIADPQAFEVKQLQAKLLQSQASLRAVQSRLEETVVRSASAGVVTRVAIEIGETAVPNQSVISVIGDQHLEIKVDIPESDINKIQIGQKAEITLDAFGFDRKFFGTVNFVEPSETLIQDVVYYRVTIYFDEEYAEIKPGMTADIIIPTAKKEGVLNVPIRAVISVPGGKKIIRVLRGGIVSELEVTVGIRGDDGNVEILSGLAVGDQVIIGERQK